MKISKIVVCLVVALFSIATLRAGEQVADRKTVIVGGLVARPGEMQFRPNTTIYAMIMAAGGPTELGSLKRVDVYRGNKRLRFDLTDEKVRNKEMTEPNDGIAVREVFTPGR